MKKYILIFILFVGVFDVSYAQEAERKGFFLNNRLYRAHKEFSRHHYEEAARKYERLYEKEKLNDIEKGDYAEVLLHLHESEKAEQVLTLIPQRTPHENELLYAAAMENQNYAKAEELLKENPELKLDDLDQLNNQNMEDYLTSINYYEKYSITNLDINTTSSEFSPFPYKDRLYFTSTRGGKGFFKGADKLTGESYLSVYYADQEGKVSKGNNDINDGYHSGPICFNKAGDVMYVVQNSYQVSNLGNKKEDVNSQVIFKSEKDASGKWGDLVALPFTSKTYSCGHPFLSADEKMLLFTSDMPGGYGGADLYYVTIDSTSYGEPVNFGSDINTSKDDMFPFMTEDGTLYFSSDGYLGFGGLDVMVAHPDGLGYKVENMGSPVNSNGDDFSLFFVNDRTAYLASNRVGGVGGDDIYKLLVAQSLEVNVKVVDKVTKEVLPMSEVVISSIDGDKLYQGMSDDEGRLMFNTEEELDSLVFYVAEHDGYKRFDAKRIFSDSEHVLELETTEHGIYGYVYDAVSGVKLENAHIHIIFASIEERDILARKGEYRQTLKADKVYQVVATKTGYFPYEFEVNTATFESWKAYNVPMQAVMELKDIYYDFDKWDITVKAAAELDNLVKYLLRYPDINVRLESHTDARGTRTYNQSLSVKRGIAARDYLISHGIEAERLSVKGWGEDKLVNSCSDGVECDEMQHQANRRTELHVIVP